MKQSPFDIEREMDAVLRSCSAQAVAAWTHLRFVMEYESSRFGFLHIKGTPLSAQQIARKSNCDEANAAPVLQELRDVKLIDVTADGWYSPDLARMESTRAESRARARKCRDRHGGARAPNVAPLVARMSRALSQPAPPSHSPPGENKIAAQSLFNPGEAGGAGMKPAATEKAAKKRKSKRDRTPEEHKAWGTFIHTWCEVIWPEFHGGEVYDMNRAGKDDADRPHRCVWKILDFVHMDLEKALLAARSFANASKDWSKNHPNPLGVFSREVLKWVNHARLFGESNVNRNLNTARPGEFVEDLPTGVRAYASQKPVFTAAG